MKTILLTIGLLFTVNSNAAVIHNYEFGNTANNVMPATKYDKINYSIVSGSLSFTSDMPLIKTSGKNYDDISIINFNATINGRTFDMNNNSFVDVGYEQTYDRGLANYSGYTNSVNRIRSYVWYDTNKLYRKPFSMSLSGAYLVNDIRWLDLNDETGFGSGYFSLEDKDEKYAAKVGFYHYDTISAVPIPAAAWLFGTGLLGLVAIARRK